MKTIEKKEDAENNPLFKDLNEEDKQGIINGTFPLTVIILPFKTWEDAKQFITQEPIKKMFDQATLDYVLDQIDKGIEAEQRLKAENTPSEEPPTDRTTPRP